MPSLDPVFDALADPVRRAILARLALGEAAVGELAGPFAISLPAVSRHLKVLETAQLISNERRGKGRIVQLRPQRLEEARDWLDFNRRFWSGGLDRLDAHLKSEPKKEPKP